MMGFAALSPSYLLMWLNDFNFPRYRGGLMYWADTVGVGEVYRQIAL